MKMKASDDYCIFVQGRETFFCHVCNYIRSLLILLPESKRVQQKNMKYPLECMCFPLIPLWFAASRISRTSGFRCDSTRFLTNAVCPFAFASGLSCCSLHPDRDSCRWGCGEGCRRLDKRWQSWSLYRLAPGRDEHHCDSMGLFEHLSENL